MKKRARVKRTITSGTTDTWTNNSGDVYLHSIEIASTSGTPNTTITIDHTAHSNDHLLVSEANSALDTLVYLPENVIQIEKGDAIKVTSSTAGSFSILITTSLPE